MADGSWQGVDEEDQEDDEDDQNESDDDVLLVIPPDEVVQALEGAHEPGEGGVWAAEREARGNQGRGSVVHLQNSLDLSKYFRLPLLHKEKPENGRSSQWWLKTEAIYPLGQ